MTLLPAPWLNMVPATALHKALVGLAESEIVLQQRLFIATSITALCSPFL